MGEFNLNDHYIYYCGQESLRRNGVAIIFTKESEMQYLDAISKTTEEESEKVGLKLNIQYIKIMASGSVSSWQIDVETVADFIFLGSKITADGVGMKLKDAYSLEGKL